MLRLSRRWFTPQSTIGNLALDGVHFCYVLEPPQQADKPRCIPVGEYTVAMQPSQRFSHNKRVSPDGLMPFLQDVDGFVGTMFHPGNYPRDTESCLLPGFKRGPDCVMSSTLAFLDLRAKVEWPTTLIIEEVPPIDEVEYTT